LEASYHPSFNIAPSQVHPIIVKTNQKERFLSATWGLIPHWAKDDKMSFINARVESAAEKPAFRNAFAHHRCLVPADGFYEWKKEGKRKQPYYFTLPDRQPFFFAGLYQESPKLTFAILTTVAAKWIANVHDRMPVILSQKQFEPWLSGQNFLERLT